GRGLGWSTLSNLVLRVGNFVVSLIMARLIAPEEFGVFAVALTLWSGLSTLAEFGLGPERVRARDPQRRSPTGAPLGLRASGVLAVALTVWSVLSTLAEFGLGSDLVRARDPQRRIPTVATLGLLTSGVLAAGMALSAGPLAAAFRSPGATPVIMVMSIGLAIFGFSIVPAAMLQRAFRQRTLFAVNGTALILSASTLTVLAWLGFGPMALAIGQVTTQLVTVAGLYLATRLPLRLGLDRRIAAESAGFCLPLAVANLLSWLLISIDNLVVARTLSQVELGLYVLAFNDS